MRLQPNLFLIGGMRCGSTSLYNLLSQHPDIAMSKIKEPMYWLAETERISGQPDTVTSRKYTSTEKYNLLFSGMGNVRWRGEASHYLYSPVVIPVIAKQCPNSRFVVSLRDPVERLFSEYLYRLRVRSVTGSFEDFAFADISRDRNGRIANFGPESRLRKGLQAQLLTPWFEQLGVDAIKPLLFDRLQQQPYETARELYDWLSVDSEFVAEVLHMQKSGIPKFPALFHMIDMGGGKLRTVLRSFPPVWRKKMRLYFYSVSLEKPLMTANTKATLREFYRADIIALEQLIGQDLSHWRSA